MEGAWVRIPEMCDGLPSLHKNWPRAQRGSAASSVPQLPLVVKRRDFRQDLHQDLHQDLPEGHHESDRSPL